jgi:hypothetical protein
MKIMKNVLSLLFVACILTTACTKQSHGLDDLIPHQQGVEDNPHGGGGATVSTVPAAVLSAFNQRYPGATKVEWKQLSDGNYKVEFFKNGAKWQATFTSTGKLVKEEHR